MRTPSDLFLALSATIIMPPFMWSIMRPHCQSCGNFYHDRDGHRWRSFSREQLHAAGARELCGSGGDVMLIIPLTVLWLPSLDVPDPESRVPPFCLLHEVRAEWDARVRTPKPFGVQDPSAFESQPLTETSYSRGGFPLTE